MSLARKIPALLTQSLCVAAALAVVSGAAAQTPTALTPSPPSARAPTTAPAVAPIAPTEPRSRVHRIQRGPPPPG